MMVTVLGIVLPAVALMRDRDRGTIVAPMIFLSGVFTPTESLAAAMRVLPLRYYVDVATSVLFRGAQLSEVVRPIGIILALAVLLLLTSHRRFRAHLASRFP